MSNHISPRERSDESPASDRTEILDDCSGRGTADDPYVLTTVVDLDAIRVEPTAHYELGADIDAIETQSWNDGAGFEPIGDDATPFSGMLDGCGHEITGLYICRPEDRLVGLVSVNTGTIERLKLDSLEVTGAAVTGGIAGEQLGTIRRCTVDGTIEGENAVGSVVGKNLDRIDAVTSNATVTGEESVGGLAGENRCEVLDNGLAGDHRGEISDSANEGTVTGTTQVGGITGKNSETIRDSTSTGSVSGETDVGGIAGHNRGTIESVRSDAEVTGDKRVGGLAGENSTGQVLDSHASGDVIGGRSVGGIVGENSHNSSVIKNSRDGYISGAKWIGGVVGWQEGTVRHCAVTGRIEVDEFVAGGIAGKAGSGTIEESVADCNIDCSGIVVGGLVGKLGSRTTLHDSLATGSVSGEGIAGGCVGEGEANAEIRRVLATGRVRTFGDESVAKRLVERILTVLGYSGVGGVVGKGRATVADSYWDTETTNQSSDSILPAARGLRTERLQGDPAQEHLSAFDFDQTWRTNDGDYPTLRSLPTTDTDYSDN
ncbi:hypothetical protein B1756_14445 [Natrarchaeobaculum aegyptiacum]|uniref:GLUG domain-containing protein n=2 Tax=Natrarchaeobaculum aegyptiacum TaxID=745377 RepID=A0A2Z2HVK3_9EURY|nr:hypothetical protein B1756_14445 [Natrarchaeobaculum aegyptiacum]